MSTPPPTTTGNASRDAGKNPIMPSWMPQVPLPPELRRVRWGIIRILTVVAAAVIAVVVCLIPPTYEATSSFVPVRDKYGSGTEGSAGVAQALGIGIGTAGDATSTYLEVLRSRSLIEAVITKPIHDPLTGKTTTYLEAMKIRNPQTDRRLFLAVLRFQECLKVFVDRKSGVFHVTLAGSNPGLIKVVVNDLIAELQRYTIRTRSETAGRNREFVEREKAETNLLLASAEGELNRFRERNMRIGNSPQLLLEQDRLVRNLRVQEEVYIALVRQYESAKLDEARSTPMISVLDPAIQPPFKTAPRRLFLFVLGVGTVFLASVAVSSWMAAEPTSSEAA